MSGDIGDAALRLAAVCAAALLVAACAPAGAHAAVGATAVVGFPASVTVGQTGAPASLTLTNANTALNLSLTNTVCNAGDASPPCSSPEPGIVLDPSCSAIASGACAPGGADPNVFAVAPTGTGRLGTACTGMPFAISAADASGALVFTPQPAGVHVTLPLFGTSCTIDFSFDVLRRPATDADLGLPGRQTAQATSHTQYATLLGTETADTATAVDETTVLPGSPVIATVASPDVVLGAGQLSDQATVIGRVAPTAGATVDFRLYGPTDPTCAAPPVFTSLGIPYPVGGGAVASAPFTPLMAGTYRWVATYSGDANNDPAGGGCGDANETRVVMRAASSIATTASPGVALGSGPLSDQATVTGRVSPVAGGVIDFRLYGPDDADCGDPPVFSSLAVPYPVGGGAVSSAAFTPASVGTYRWVASYSGDANNAPAVSACNAPGETTIVTRAVPALATTASPGVALGAGPLSDQATVTGRVSPLPGAAVDFRLYGPADPTCSGPPAFSSLAVPYPVGGGAVTSAPYTPTAAGTYRWIARYGGDANNAPAAGACGDAGETTVVTAAAPSIATTASPDIVLGAGTLSDQATVTGRVSPLAGATIDFRLYGPDDPACVGAAVFASLDVPYSVAGGAIASAAFTPTAAGTYRWVATYSGDANNGPAVGGCGDGDETRVVTRATPAIATTASPDIVLGAGTLSDQATVTGRASALPGATIDFRLYGPDDAGCSGPPAFTSLGVAYPQAGGPVASASFTPSAAGTYRWVATYSGDDNNAPIAGACDEAGETTTVARATPTIATSASPDIALGTGALSDQATINGRFEPRPGATVDFRLYGPGDASCAGPPVFESLGVSVPTGDGAIASQPFTPTAAGTYRWVASYGGDANNAPAQGTCDDANETRVVSQAATALATAASPDIVVGAGQLSDQAVVNGRVGPLPGATVDFRLYGPHDAGCSGAPAFESLGVAYPVAGGPVESAAFTPTAAGTYRWVATYSGDANNGPAAGACDDADETTIVARIMPVLATTPSPGVVLGAGPLTDVATVSGRVNPEAGASIDFRLFGPDDPTCAQPAAFTSLGAPYPAAGGPVASAPFTPAAAGAYRWTVAYSGDANNLPVEEPCDDANRTDVSAPATPPPPPPPPPPPTTTPQPAAPAPATTQPTAAARPTTTTPDGANPDAAAPDEAAPAVVPDASAPSPDATAPPPDAGTPAAGTEPDAQQEASATPAARTTPRVTPDSADTPGAGPEPKERQQYAPYDPRSEPEKTVGILVGAMTLMQLATSAGGLARARGRGHGTRGAARRRSKAGARRRGRTQAAAGGGADDGPSYDMGYEGLEVAFIGAGLGAVQRGDRSRSWSWPGTSRLDRVSYALPARLSHRSPLLARIAADGTYLRAIFGSASLLGPVVGLILGIVAVHDTGGEALPPVVGLTIAIAMLGVLDAAAGLAAVLTFSLGVLLLGGVDSESHLRLMLGLGALWFVTPLIAGAARPLRREPTKGLTEVWERAADFVIASLTGAWAVQNLVAALPGLAGLELPIGDYANPAAICVLAALVFRLGLETLAAYLYPRRLDVAESTDLPEPSALQRATASLIRTALFLFFAYVIVGSSWQLWTGAALFLIPQLLAIYEEQLPNSPRLFRALPSGLVEIVIMLFVMTAFGALLVATMDENADTFLATSFVLLSLPGFLLSVLGLFGRDGDERAMNWGKRIAGVGLLIVAVLMTLGMLL